MNYLSVRNSNSEKKNRRYHYIFNHLKGAFKKPEKGPKSFRFKNMNKVSAYSWKKN